MNKLKFSEDLFLDNLELNKLSQFIFDDSLGQLLKVNSDSFGIVKNNKIGEDFTDFQVSQDLDVLGDKTISIQNGTLISINSAGQVCISRNNLNSPIPISNSSAWYWLKISAKESVLEKGVVDITSDGVCTGVGTQFTKVLRGQPNFPSKIKFYKRSSDGVSLNNSTLNVQEYEVVQVISDTQLLLSGDFTTETELLYSVIGTFTPGFIPLTENKNIFRYSELNIELVAESSLDGSPIKPFYVQDKEFFICRLRNLSGVVEIQDYRTEFFKFNGVAEIDYISNQKNEIIGVESIKYDNENSSLENNIVKVGFGVTSNSFSVNTNQNKIVLNTLSGGIFKDSALFTNGMFDEYRLYVDFISNKRTFNSEVNQEGYYIIKNSVKVGTTIEVILDRLSPQDFEPILYNSAVTYKQGDKVSFSSINYILVDSDDILDVSPDQTAWSSTTLYVGEYVKYGQQVYKSLSSNTNQIPSENSPYWKLIWNQYVPKVTIVPNVEEIVIEVTSNKELVKTVFSDIRNGFVLIPLLALNLSTDTTKNYSISYYHKNHKVYGPKYTINSDSVGYINEENVLTPYISDMFKDFLRLIKNRNALSLFRDRIDKGDITSVNPTDLSLLVDNDAYKCLKVGQDRQYQSLVSSTPYSLVQDHIINLSKFKGDGSAVADGSRFFIQIKQKLITGSFNLIFKVGDDVSPGIGGTVIHTCTNAEYEAMDYESGVLYQFIYSKDLDTWLLHQTFISKQTTKFIKEVKVINSQNQSVTLPADQFGAFVEYPSLVNESSGGVSVPEGTFTYGTVSTNYSSKWLLNGVTNQEMKIELPVSNVDKIYEVDFRVGSFTAVTNNGDAGADCFVCISVAPNNPSTGDVLGMLDINKNAFTYVQAAAPDNGNGWTILSVSKSKAIIKVTANEELSVRGHVKVSSFGGSSYIRDGKLLVKEL
jgi:hypothetical protein